MANAYRDENSVPTLVASEDTAPSTLVRIKVDPITHGLAISDGASGSDLGPVNAARDQNSVPGLLAVSSSDGVTQTSVYGTSAGALKVNSN